MPNSPDPAEAVLVLAAGASTRMGEPKLLLPLDGEPLVRRAARRALESGASQVVVVIGRGDAAMRAALNGLAIGIVETPVAGAPISTSIHAGLDALHERVESVVIMLADMVRVTTPMLRQLLEAARAPTAPLVISRYGEVTAPPLVFPRRLFRELRTASGDSIGREVMSRHRADAQVQDWPPDALRDVDTPSDYHELVSE